MKPPYIKEQHSHLSETYIHTKPRRHVFRLYLHEKPWIYVYVCYTLFRKRCCHWPCWINLVHSHVKCI